MSVDRETYHADIEQVREIAHRLLRFARATPPRPDFCVGYILGERLACLVEDQGEAADIAWLIEIMGDSIAVLAASYGIAGPAFVAGVIGKGIDASCAFVANGIDAFAAEHLPANAGGQACRAARRFALVAMAGELARELGVLPWSEGEASRAVAALLRQWLAGRGGAGASEDGAAIAQVRAFLELHGSSRFEMIRETIEGQEVLGDGRRAVISRAGFFRMDHAVKQRVFYVMPEAWKEICAGIDPKRTARLLADRGMLLKDSAGGNSCPVNVPTIGKMRVYVVLPSIFTDQTE